MASVFHSSDEPFGGAGDRWDLARLYKDLAAAKQQVAPHKRRGLSEAEKTYLRGLLCDASPAEIARELNKARSTVNWALCETIYRYAESLSDRPPNSVSDWSDIRTWLAESGYLRDRQCLPPRSRLLEDWHTAPDVSDFVGRTSELATLSQWILHDRCRLIAIAGMGGIGKTTLSVKLAQQLRQHFQVVIWRSFRYLQSFEAIAIALPQLLGRSPATFSDPRDSALSHLIDTFQARRCLVVLDGVETLLQPREFAGHYHPDYHAYRELIHRVAVEPHQSCLILTGREKIKEIATLVGPTQPVRSFSLGSLGAAAEYILQNKGLPAQKNSQTLIELYRGNPLALKIVSGTIRNVFGGNIKDFLNRSSLFLGDFSEILSQQFQRLSLPEKELLYGLALSGEPIKAGECRKRLGMSLSDSEVLAAIESLEGRSLLEKVADSGHLCFTLQPVVMKYVTGQLVEQICQEAIAALNPDKPPRFGLLHSPLLLQFQTPSPRESDRQNYQKILAKVTHRLRQIAIGKKAANPDAYIRECLACIPQ